MDKGHGSDTFPYLDAYLLNCSRSNIFDVEIKLSDKRKVLFSWKRFIPSIISFYTISNSSVVIAPFSKLMAGIRSPKGLMLNKSPYQVVKLEPATWAVHLIWSSQGNDLQRGWLSSLLGLNCRGSFTPSKGGMLQVIKWYRPSLAPVFDQEQNLARLSSDIACTIYQLVWMVS